MFFFSLNKQTAVYLLGKCHAQKSLVDYGLWSPKESDTTQRLKTTANSNNNKLYKGPVSKYSHILRYWGLGLEYEFWRDTVWSMTVNICNCLSLLPSSYVVPFSSPPSPKQPLICFLSGHISLHFLKIYINRIVDYGLFLLLLEFQIGMETQCGISHLA